MSWNEACHQGLSVTINSIVEDKAEERLHGFSQNMPGFVQVTILMTETAESQRVVQIRLQYISMYLPRKSETYNKERGC